MNIAFAGTHCTGKTTLLKQLMELFPADEKHIYITEIARSIIQRGFPLNMDATKDSYANYINDQLTAERGMKNAELFISDRTLLDPLAYARVNKNYVAADIDDFFIEMMENIWLLEKKQYDIYIFFPIEFPLVEDGIRPVNQIYRQKVSEMIWDLLNRHHINYTSVSGTHDERLGQLMKIINSSL